MVDNQLTDQLINRENSIGNSKEIYVRGKKVSKVMNKQELIQLIDILDKSEIHIEAGGKILAFINYDNLNQFTKILGIDSENYINCILRDKCVVINLIDIDTLDCEEIELIENRYENKEK